MSDEPEDQDMVRLKAVCAELGEHFDSIQIFCTRQQDEQDGEAGTVNCSWGSGNWFTRKGQVSEWLLKAEERTRMEVRTEDA